MGLKQDRRLKLTLLFPTVDEIKELGGWVGGSGGAGGSDIRVQHCE